MDASPVTAAQLYDALGHDYEQAFGHQPAALTAVERLLPLLPAGARVLDLGSGTGWPITAAVAAAGHQVTGYDVSEKMVAIARSRVPTARFNLGDMRTIDFPDATFDAVLSMFSMLQLTRDEQTDMISRVATWLAPGGYLVLATVPHPPECNGRTGNWMGHVVKTYSWPHAKLRENLQAGGLTIVRDERVIFTPDSDKADGEEQIYLTAQKPGSMVRRMAPPRLRWADVPGPVRTAAESALGARVTGDVSQSGGFSPGLASRLVLADGRRVFAKAISAARNPRSPGLYRREIEVMTALPESVPAPRLRWSFDDGDWVMLVLDDVDGAMPAQPWEPREFARVLAALEQLSDALTPAPIAAMSIVDDLGENFRSWKTIAADPTLIGRLDAWAQANLARLVELESGWAAAARGETLLHADLRADNLLLTAERVMVVDWPYAVTGAAWVDALLFLPSVAATSSVDPGQVWAGFRPARDADPDAVNAVLAAAAGDFLYQSVLPAPENLPTLRAHQQQKGAAALAWLRARIN